MPVRLGVFELVMILTCLLVLVALAVAVAVLLLRARPAAGEGRDRLGADLPEVMTPAEVAAWLRVDLNTVETLIEDGKLPAVKVGGEWRVSRADLLAFVDAGGDSEAGSQVVES
jgi:excisionase family DNA binding protein